MPEFQNELKQNPVVAILRGLRKEHASEVAELLVESGIRILEVPLNRDGALDALEQIKRTHGDVACVGAGTVVSRKTLKLAADAGADFCLAPNLNESILLEAKELGISFVPGALTPSEVFRAIELGSKVIKIFPFDQFGYASLRALLQVMPEGTDLLGVGGLKIDDLDEALSNGLAGIGVGSSLYRAGMEPSELRVYLKKNARQS
jgi:2-dehydro-3-deoxyphosphogalactonate aldolase